MSSRAAWVLAVMALIGLVVYLLIGRGEPPQPTIAVTEVSDTTTTAPTPKTTRSSSPEEVTVVTHALRGQVEAQGKPVAGAVVTVVDAEADQDVLPRTVLTDAQGRFELSSLAAGRYAVSATASGHLPAVLRGVVLDEAVSITLTLVPGGHPLRGTVSDATGGALDEALVRVVPVGGVAALRRLDGFGALSDDDGRYTVHVAPGRYRVEVSHSDYASQRRTVEVGPGAQSQDFALVPMGVIEGVVRRDEGGAPVPRAWVTWQRERQTTVAPGQRVSMAAGGGTVRADDEGRYRVSGLDPGAITLRARGAEVASLDPTVVFLAMAEHVTDADLFVAKAYDIRGQVVAANDASAPIAGATVQVVGDRFAPVAGTDAEGHFVLRGVLEGPQTVMARARGWLPGLPGVRIEVGPGLSTQTIALERAPSIRGRVEPPTVAQVSIELRPETVQMGSARRASMMIGGGAAAESDAEGQFELGPATPGPTTVVARVADGRAGEATVEVGADGADDVVITLEPRATVRGVVRSASGAPVGQASVSLRREQAPSGTSVRLTVNGRDMGAETGTSVDDGSFEIAGVAAGDYEVRIVDRYGELLTIEGGLAAAKDGTASLTVDDGKDRDGLELVVDAHDGVIRGTVETADGEPASDIWVRVALVPELQQPEPEPDGDQPRQHSEMRMIVDSGDGNDDARPPVLTDEDGRFEVVGLRDARYELVAEGGGGRERTTAVARPGDDITLALAALGTVEGEVTLDGQPLKRYSVRVEGPTSRVAQVRDSGGHFELDRLEPGRYQLVVTAPDGNGRAEVTVSAGQTVTQDVVLEHMTRVTGRIVDEQGEPIVGAVVVTGSGDNGRVSIQQSGTEEQNTTDEQGRFELSCGAGSRALVALSPTNPRPLVMHMFEAKAGESIDLGDLKKREMGGMTGRQQPAPQDP
ncbi:MAG: carboxypeptidase regulatory-like domain-containing protein [Deltaproteobacteria bacterium]|nr:carboxypeptidase regulatory-like domain-containing protein [Deltaproteobacteria bacterium]